MTCKRIRRLQICRKNRKSNFPLRLRLAENRTSIFPEDFAGLGRKRKRGRAPLGAGDTADGKPVVLVVVVSTWVDIRRIHVQVIRVVTIVSRRRPIVRVVAAIVRGGAIPVAGVDKPRHTTNIGGRPIFSRREEATYNHNRP